MAIDTKYGRVVVEREPSTPLNYTNEPVFVIRAQDEFAIAALRAYGVIATQNNMPEEFLESIKKVEDEFTYWRADHSDRIKKPD